MAQRSNIVVDQGSYTTIAVTVLQADGVTPVNFTGCTAAVAMFRETLDGPVLLTMSLALGTIALGGAAGTVTFTLSEAATQALAVTRGVYDVLVTFPDTHQRRQLQGAWSMDRDVTH